MKAQPIDSLPTDKAFLHFEAARTSPNEVQVDYELILPLHEVDCRGTFDHNGGKRPKSHRMVWLDKNNRRHLPLGRTKIGTSLPAYPFVFGDEIDLPFRDGAHMGWDNEKLNDLPVYYTMGEKHWRLNK